jgi:hypothetical protein
MVSGLQFVELTTKIFGGLVYVLQVWQIVTHFLTSWRGGYKAREYRHKKVDVALFSGWGYNIGMMNSSSSFLIRNVTI